MDSADFFTEVTVTLVDPVRARGVVALGELSSHSVRPFSGVVAAATAFAAEVFAGCGSEEDEDEVVVVVVVVSTIRVTAGTWFEAWVMLDAGCDVAEAGTAAGSCAVAVADPVFPIASAFAFFFFSMLAAQAACANAPSGPSSLFRYPAGQYLIIFKC